MSPRLLFLLLLIITPALASTPAALDATLHLWYRQPAQVWTEALPVGNGGLGAMVFGGVEQERLQVNEDTLWTGEPHEYQHPGAVEVLPELRRLLGEGRQKEAETLAMERFMSIPLRQMMYQPFCDVYLDFAPATGEVAEYRRELDLDRAVASVSYRADGVRYTRETFSSHPDQVLVERLRADQPGRISFKVRLTSPHASAVTIASGRDQLALDGRVGERGTRFAARLKVTLDGGRIRAEGDHLVIEEADAATVVLSGATAFVNFQDVTGDPAAQASATLAAATKKPAADLAAAHSADHQSLFRRVTLDLGTTPAASRATDERLAVEDKRGDPALATLLFNFGRYLLIASSRPGDQPANLQGIWNDRLNPPWGSKYTTNINAEMNYWPAEVANLTECAEPLFAMIDDLVISGRKTAQAHYGARGWVLHHNTDLWRGTAPINHANHGIWPTGGAWLCYHLWEHYLFSGDRDFLARRAYPVMKGAALFFIDYLVRDLKTGWMISGPSNSPEQGGLVMGPAMDHQIIRALFSATASAAEILGVDEDLAAKLWELREQIAPDQIGRHGQLQEWLEDKDDPQNKHRHVSHLWAVFPGHAIRPQTPELFAAARQSLLFRGDGGTGWSLGWKIALWARFLDGDHAHRILMNQLSLVRDRPDGTSDGKGGGTYPNLFDAHPPFQIDGNFAATAGICEMLVQSHLAEIVLLPALPSAWPNGSVTGLRARGGFEVDLAWRDCGLTRVVLRSAKGGAIPVRYGETRREIRIAPGGSIELGAELNPVAR